MFLNNKSIRARLTFYSFLLITFLFVVFGTIQISFIYLGHLKDLKEEILSETAELFFYDIETTPQFEKNKFLIKESREMYFEHHISGSIYSKTGVTDYEWGMFLEEGNPFKKGFPNSKTFNRIKIGEESYYQYQHPFERLGTPYFISLITPIPSILYEIKTIGKIFLYAYLCLLLFMVPLIDYLVRKITHPMVILKAELDKMNSEALGKKITFYQGPQDEFFWVIEGINHLNKRIHFAFKNLKHIALQLSHEIRTPLALILQAIQNQDLKSTQHIVNREVDHITSILEKSKYIHLLKDQSYPSETASIKPAYLIKTVLECIQALYPDRSFNYVKSPSFSYTIETDHTLVRMLIKNVLENAAKHSTPETPIEIKWENSSLKICNKAAVEKWETLNECLSQPKNQDFKLDHLGIRFILAVSEVLEIPCRFSYDNGTLCTTISFNGYSS